jgi:hypothetical protein
MWDRPRQVLSATFTCDPANAILARLQIGAPDNLFRLFQEE